MSIVLASTLVASCSFAAPPRFDVFDLGTLGGEQSVAFGLNDQGVVVGWANTPRGALHACRWTDGSPTDLGTLGGTQSRAWAINNAGVVVGESLLLGGAGSGQFKAFIINGGPMTQLPGLGGNWSVAYAINESGEAAGIAANGSQQEKMATWTNDVVTNLGPLTFQQRTRGYGINATGAVAGWGYTPLGGPNDALLYDPSINDIIQISGFGQFQNSEAYDVNDAGIVVGNSAPSQGGDWTAAVWYPDAITKPVILGSFAGYEISELYDINNANIAVGRAYTFMPIDQQSHAIYFDGTTLFDLNDFVPAETGGFVFEARHVNEMGQIAATMVIDGKFRAVLLSPAPKLVGDLNGDGIVNADDLGVLLGAWGACEGCFADLNGDGDVGAPDLGMLLGSWTN